MIEEQYIRALQIKERIDHIDNLLSFLKHLTENPGDGTKAFLRETGFIAHPEEAKIFQADVVCLWDALESEKARLNHEFNRL